MIQTADTQNETFQDRVDRERSERKEQYQALYNGLAPHLNGWRINIDKDHEDGWCEENRWRFVSDVPEQGISLRIEKGKVTVSGYWPKSGNGYISPYQVREESPSINCSPSKSHELIARDIVRRFLPEYQRIWDKISSKIAEDNSYLTRKNENWARLVASGGVVNPRNANRGDEDPRADIRMPGGYDRGYGSVRMTADDSVQIELRSLPVDVAILVLNALKEVK